MPAIPPNYPDVEMGVDCPGCTPSPWPAGKTPKTMYCVFTRIMRCPRPEWIPQGHIFHLAQQAGDPCEYRIKELIKGVYWSIVYYADHAELKGYCHSAPAQYFFLGSGPTGALKFDNTCPNCQFYRGMYGYGWLLYTAVPIVSSYTTSYSMVQRLGSNYQLRTPRPELHQTNLSRKSDHTHCLVNIIPEFWTGP